jgi:thiaminase (transcriptional activator TenA)
LRKNYLRPYLDQLKQKHIKDWNALLNHKFIAEMANDSLQPKKFIFYLEQDHLFLKEFCLFLRNAKTKSTEPEMKEFFDSVYKSTVDYEMPMQRDLLSSLGVSDFADVPVNAAPATDDYISFLKRTSSSGTLEIMLSAMAPCPWSYLEIAEKLSNDHIRTKAYCKWIKFYASNESRLQVNELKAILDQLYHKTNLNAKQLMSTHFGIACKHEYHFWETAYNMA